MERREARPPRRTRTALGALALVALALAAFSPVIRADFIPLDDPLYVTQRPEIVGGLSRQNLLWAWTSTEGGVWMPVTRMSLQLDGTLSGSAPLAYHVHGWILHAANALLVFLILHRATGCLGRSLVAAALWAVHPLRVEPVAWAAERKGLASSFWGLLAILAYVRFVREHRLRAHALAAACFAVAMLAKVAFAVLPLLLLLLDYWPLGRIRSWRDARAEALRKAPLFAIAGAGVAIPYLALESIGALKPLGLRERLENVVSSYALHLWKALTADDLAVYYAREAHLLGAWPSAAVVLLLAAVTLAVLGLRRGHPWLLVGWLWFAIAVLPTSSFVQAGSLAFADRYTYLPSVGLVLMAVWSVPQRWLAAPRPRAAALAAAAALLALEARASWVQAGVWRDPVTLFEQAARVDPGSYVIQTNLASAWTRRGDLARAARHLRRATRILPDYPRGYRDLGRVLGMQGAWKRAAEQLRRAVELAPSWVRARDDYAMALARLGRLEEARAQLEIAARLDPRDELVRAHRAELSRGGASPPGFGPDLGPPP